MLLTCYLLHTYIKPEERMCVFCSWFPVVLVPEEPSESVLVQLILSLLQLCKVAANHPGGAHILGTTSGLSSYICIHYTR